MIRRRSYYTLIMRPKAGSVKTLEFRSVVGFEPWGTRPRAVCSAVENARPETGGDVISSAARSGPLTSCYTFSGSHSRAREYGPLREKDTLSREAVGPAQLFRGHSYVAGINLVWILASIVSQCHGLLVSPAAGATVSPAVAQGR